MKIMLSKLLLGFVIRLLCIYVGIFIDKYWDKLNYTDVDYHIFSDAAKLMVRGVSPFERSTYRYPPALAGLLMSNEWIPETGKIFFAAADVWIIYLIFHTMVLSGIEKRLSSFVAFLWIFNPASINICTRGSADSITNAFVLLFLCLLFSGQSFLSGLIFGLVVHLRIYPIIYLPAILYHLWLQRQQKDRPKNSGIVGVLKFIIGGAFGGGITTWFSYSLYGEDYLQHAIYYHLARSDHRHNFSIHFYGIYLTSNSTLGDVVAALESVANSYLPSFIDRTNFSSICRANEIVCSTVLRVSMFAPQLLLFAGLVLMYAKDNLALCLLLQTMVFVTYNKVITAQYFTWYLCLVPLSTPALLKIPKKLLVIVCLLWLCALSAWLAFAYQLEFSGANVFFEVWVCSVLFHLANVVMIGVIIAYA